MESLYQDAGRLYSETELLLQQLVNAPAESTDGRVRENLDQLRQILSRLQLLARKELPSRRQEANMRVEQLQMEVSSLDRAYHRHNERQAELTREARQREELLTHRLGGPTGGASRQPVDHALQLENDLSRGNQDLDHLISHGGSIVSSLKDQHSIYKGAQRKLLDLTSTLGLSNTVMRIIERRTAQDMYIFWTGLVITALIIAALIYYFVL